MYVCMYVCIHSCSYMISLATNQLIKLLFWLLTTIYSYIRTCGGGLHWGSNGGGKNAISNGVWITKMHITSSINIDPSKLTAHSIWSIWFSTGWLGSIQPTWFPLPCIKIFSTCPDFTIWYTYSHTLFPVQRSNFQFMFAAWTALLITSSTQIYKANNDRGYLDFGKKVIRRLYMYPSFMRRYVCI